MPTIEIQIDRSEGDAHETASGASFTYTSTTLRCEASTSSTTRYNAGLWYPNVPIPNISGIDSVDEALVSVVFPVAQRDSPDLDWKGEDVDDSDDFATTADVTSRTRTTASVNWSGTNLGGGVFVDSPSLVSIVVEIITRGGWASGNNMALFADGENATPQESGCRFTSFNAVPTEACILTIDYTLPAPPRTFPIVKPAGLPNSNPAYLLGI